MADGGQQPLLSPLEIPGGVKQEYQGYHGAQASIPNTPVLNQQLDDPNNQDVWHIVDSLDAGDEFNNKWMGAESGED
jgi:hypothetical protein